jgi:hypothetical protein
VGQKILLYSKYCRYCDKAKELLRDDILHGKIKLINIDRDSEGREIAKLFGGVPTLIEEEDGEIHELIMR